MLRDAEVQPGHVVELHWLDTRAEAGWRKSPHAGSVVTVRSAGIVVDNLGDCLILTTSMNADGWAKDPLSIPWCCIMKIDLI